MLIFSSHLLRGLVRRAIAFALAACIAPAALADIDGDTLARLASGDNAGRLAAIDRLGKSGDAQALAVLQALADGRLRRGEGGRVWLEGEGGRATDPLTGATQALPADAGRITLNNRLRRALSVALATGQLSSPDAALRLAAAHQLRHASDAGLIPVLREAVAAERDGEVRRALEVAQANLELQSPEPRIRLHAVELLSVVSDASFRSVLAAMLEQRDGTWNEPDPEVRRAAQRAVDAIDAHLRTVQWLGNLFYGVSLGSVLLLAALGLAIIFGLMGVINMAHGELLMIGAYATYLVQQGFREFAPLWLDWYVVAALPVAFVLTACVGMALERTVIRWLYGRPLETLLATWGISLVLMQAVRSLFGAQNVEVANPGWLSGGVALMNGLVLSYNRLAVIAFSLLVVAFVWLLLNHTRLGLFVRAITQNRRMADCCGVPTGRVDMLTFGLGAGIAGLAGVALSQLGNVGPDLGRGYIIDSFMVVVLGGVGQLAGTVIAAFGLGGVAKFIEPFAGAVLAKIAILVLIVLFIQKRPQGLFSPKGRSVE